MASPLIGGVHPSQHRKYGSRIRLFNNDKSWFVVLYLSNITSLFQPLYCNGCAKYWTLSEEVRNLSIEL